MSKLLALKDKDSKEVTKLLSLVANSLLPNPSDRYAIDKTGNESDLVEAVLSEVRTRLRLGENDQSIEAQTEIYAFLSEELSNATLTSDAIKQVEARLGNKGELHPSRYEIRFITGVEERLEAVGHRCGNVVDAVEHPDHVVHLRPKYLSEESDPRITISLKSIATKRSEDTFLLFVLSFRRGRIQYVGGAYRVYLSEVLVDDPSDPIDAVRSFVRHFGATFHFGGKEWKFMLHETISLTQDIRGSRSKPERVMRVLDRAAGHNYGYVMAGGATNIIGADGNAVFEVILGFVVDQTKYWSNLRKHHVPIHQDVDDLFAEPGVVHLSDDYQ